MKLCCQVLLLVKMVCKKHGSIKEFTAFPALHSKLKLAIWKENTKNESKVLNSSVIDRVTTCLFSIYLVYI